MMALPRLGWNLSRTRLRLNRKKCRGLCARGPSIFGWAAGTVAPTTQSAKRFKCVARAMQTRGGMGLIFGFDPRHSRRVKASPTLAFRCSGSPASLRFRAPAPTSNHPPESAAVPRWPGGVGRRRDRRGLRTRFPRRPGGSWRR